MVTERTASIRDNLVSVIIPTYNRCDRLRIALDAVCSQDVAEHEVIVVDNNSTDDTANVVGQYPDPRVRYTFCRQQGIYHALNHGFAMAKGRYLTWTSDDNWFHPGAIKTLKEALESKGADFVYSDYIVLNEATGESRLYQVKESQTLEDYCCIGFCFLFRREVYEQVGDHDLRYKWASDYDYWLKIYRAGFRMYRLALPMYTYVSHGTTVSVIHHEALQTEVCLIRIDHECHQRFWKQQHQHCYAPLESFQDASRLLQHGYRLKALMLAGKIMTKRPWSITYWQRLARLFKQGLGIVRQ